MPRNLLKELQADPRKMARFRANARYLDRKRRQGDSGVSDAIIKALGPAAWFRFGQGITVSTGVSQWSDQSGNGRHLLQATGTAQPSLQSDGSILFDGVQQFLKCNSFTLIQPETVYVLFKMVTYTDPTKVFDGNTDNSGSLTMTGGTPNLQAFAGTSFGNNTGLATGTYGVVTTIFNGATPASLTQVNNNAAVTGSSGASTMGGFTMGRAGGSAVQFGAIQAKEVIIFSAAHDADTRARVIKYLNVVGGLGL